jgi:hypothetical protein
MMGRVLVTGWRDLVRESRVKGGGGNTEAPLCVQCSTFKGKVTPSTGYEGPEGE